MKTIHSLQKYLESFKDDNMNERKEKKAINEDLLQNIMRVKPHGQPTHSTNKSKEEYHYKRSTNIPKEEEKEEHTLDLPEKKYHSFSSEGSLSRYRKRHKNDDNLQGEFQKIKSPTYEGGINTGEKDE